jgi:hypothetical protein
MMKSFVINTAATAAHCQTDRVDFLLRLCCPSLMNDGEILLLNLSKGKPTKGDARFLGIVPMAMI